MTRQAPTFGDYRQQSSPIRGIAFGVLISLGFYLLLFGMVVLFR